MSKDKCPECGTELKPVKGMYSRTIEEGSGVNPVINLEQVLVCLSCSP